MTLSVQHSTPSDGTFSAAGAIAWDANHTLTGLLDLTTQVTGDLPLANLAQSSAASKLLGRGDSGAGDFQEITLGSGLTMTGTTLAASGGGMSVGGAVTGGTANSVLFVGAGAVLAQDNASFTFSSTGSPGSGPLLNVGNGTGTSTGWQIGYAGSAGYAGLWLSGRTGSLSNYTLLQGDGASLAINADTYVWINSGNALIARFGFSNHGMELKPAAASTTDAQVLSMTQTWNNGAQAFTSIKLDVTNTASAAGSLLADLQVGSVSKFKVDKAGVVTASGTVFASDFWLGTTGSGGLMSNNTVRLNNSGVFGWTTSADATASPTTGMSFVSAGVVAVGNGTAGDFSGSLKANKVVFGGSTSGAVTVQPKAAAGTWTMTLPDSAGTSGYVLSTDGTGVTSWASVAGGTVPTGTGFTHITSGSQDGAAKLVNLTASTDVAANQGTTTTVLHGNAAGQPSWGAISLTADVSGDLPFANLVQASAASVIVGRGSASGAGDFQEITLGTNLSMSGTTLNAAGATIPTGTGFTHITAGAQDAASKLVNLTASTDVAANQGTTTTVLHGNAAGQASWGAVSLTADVSGDLPFSSFVQASAASVLVGRGSAAGAGDFQEITVGTGLSMSGTTLSATGGSTSLGLTVAVGQLQAGWL